NYLSTLNYSDWNNDGFEDVIAFYDYPQELMFYTWNGMELELQFTWPTVGEFMHVTEVETQDGDADPQFTISGSPIANRVALFEVYPNLELNFQELDESISSWADIRVADLDGDGYTEVITGGSRNRRLAYYHNQQASFSALQTIDFIPGASDNFNIEVQDADADGDMDIAAFNYEGSWLMLYMNDGNAQFTLEYVNVPYEVTSWFAADVDADQRMDYFFHGNGSLNMKMLWGSDLDNTQFQNLDFGSNDFWGIKAMDYDHDNDLDFVLNGIDTDGNGLLQLRVNDGSADPQTWAYFDIELPEATLSISNVFSSLDYNGDGYEDLIFDDGTTGNTYFIPLTSAGFGAITPFPYTDFMGVDKTHDVDGDGDKEFIARYNNLYHVFNETAPGVWESTGIYSINFSGLWLYGFQNFDMSGTPEVLTVDQENIYIDRLVLYPFGWSFTSAIFLDENANGLMDGNETIMNNAYVELDGMYNAVYQGTGTYWLPAQSGAYTVSPLYDNEVWQLTTDSASYLLDVNTEEDIPNYTLLFGLTPLGTVMSGEISTTAFGWSCILDSFTSSTVVHNTGNSYMSGVVQLEFDSSLVSVINTEPMADSIVGNTIYWSVDSLLPLSTFQYGAVFTHPGVENIGELAEFHSSLFITDELLFADDYADANFVECAYDPNDKQAIPQGFSPNGYVLADTAMEYTIRFQNTGNAPAQDVIIADQLSTHLDASSLHVLGASHPMVLQVADDGLVHFHFQNIMLPDSTADYMGSMGYVKYAVDMMPALSPGTTLQNTAHIFFDTNPPIVTNTTLNTIYTCEWLHTPVLVHYDDSLLWAPVGGIDYTWYRYGSEITIADGNTFNPLLPGEYTVLVQFEDDCEVLSEIFYYLVDEVDEITASARVHLYPNPAGEQFLVVSDQLINDITLFDAMGRAVCQRNVFAYNYSFNDLPLSPGLYLVQVSMGDYRETLRLVKK
ncbi:MAG: T9SS type A sorting domain-containing protein, partial [Flavobacteriales bacterium]